MNSESTNQARGFQKANSAFRYPKRISITVPYGADQRLLERSDHEGRSLSNLAAFLLETTLSNRREFNDPFRSLISPGRQPWQHSRSQAMKSCPP